MSNAVETLQKMAEHKLTANAEAKLSAMLMTDAAANAITTIRKAGTDGDVRTVECAQKLTELNADTGIIDRLHNRNDAFGAVLVAIAQKVPALLDV